VYKVPASTLFVGKNLVYLPQCPSTNSLASELIQTPEIPEGTLVITDDQTGGRGQRGNSWVAEPGKNLTLSVILKPIFLLPKDQFQLSQAVAVAIADVLSITLNQPAWIKWPNDVLINNRKVCGVLIENSITGEIIQHTIIGIGLNVNQTEFLIPHAGSMRSVSGRKFELNDVLDPLLRHLESNYLELKSGRAANLAERYNQQLFRRGEQHQFLAAGESFQGMIHGVAANGRLQVVVHGVRREFDTKEIAYGY
jgi:BirA family transcriptional regulator, biotin operon repressor / biotin---[acetyl-CoA-carboxylase] ligase